MEFIPTPPSSLIIGSMAARYWYPDFPRQPKDIDLFVPSGSAIDLQNRYFDLNGAKGDIFAHSDLDHWLAANVTMSRFASPSELYTIKVSHSHWELPNKSWDKHMFDVVWLKRRGARFLPELYDTLMVVWEQTHGRKKMMLNRSKEDFFSDAVVRIYDHDSIHDSVAYGDRPMYTYVLKDGAEVDMDMAKVKALPLDDQVKLFREEVYATALERLVIPSGYTHPPRAAYYWALRRTITSLTKGWSSLFMINRYEIFRTPDMDYVARHLSRKDKLISLESK